MLEPRPVLYHYTSFSALKGILGSRALWATDICCLNDAAEYRYAVNAVVARIAEVKHSGEVDAFEGKALDKLADMFVEGETPEVFVFSLSENGDLLSQWRAYSAGSNVAIGFHTERLAAIAEKSRFGLYPCEYDIIRQKTQITGFVSFSLEVMRANRQPADQPENLIRRGAFTKIWREFIQFAPLHKHPAFSEEAEWRLVSFDEVGISPARRVRIAREALIPYFELAIEEPLKDRGTGGHQWKHELPLSRIVVGPSQDPYLAQRSTRVAFYSSGVPLAHFENSKVPLRVSGP